MIKFYGGGSPNALKITLMLEEVGVAYDLINVNALRQEQFTPEFLKLNPVGKYPVIVDLNGPVPDRPIFESGAILIYLAHTYGRPFLPDAGADHWETLQWLFVQTSWIGPMLGQNVHFRIQPSEADSYAATRYWNQGRLVCETLDKRLSASPWLAAARYTIADIATFPWASSLERQGYDLRLYPAIRDWCNRIAERPAVIRAMTLTHQLMQKILAEGTPRSKEDLDRLFARTSGPTIDYSTMGIPIKSPT